MAIELISTSTMQAKEANTDTSQSEIKVVELSFDNELRAFTQVCINSEDADIYIWDRTGQSSESEEHIPHFMSGPGGDMLQLNNLCPIQMAKACPEQFLHFTFEKGSTKIEIRPDGQQSKQKHYIVLDKVDLQGLGQSDTEIIDQLMRQGNLDIVSG